MSLRPRPTSPVAERSAEAAAPLPTEALPPLVALGPTPAPAPTRGLSDGPRARREFYVDADLYVYTPGLALGADADYYLQGLYSKPERMGTVDYVVALKIEGFPPLGERGNVSAALVVALQKAVVAMAREAGAAEEDASAATLMLKDVLTPDPAGTTRATHSCNTAYSSHTTIYATATDAQRANMARVVKMLGYDPTSVASQRATRKEAELALLRKAAVQIADDSGYASIPFGAPGKLQREWYRLVERVDRTGGGRMQFTMVNEETNVAP